MHGKTIVVAIIGEDDICFEEVSCLPKYAKKKQALSIMKLRAFFFLAYFKHGINDLQSFLLFLKVYFIYSFWQT